MLNGVLIFCTSVCIFVSLHCMFACKFVCLCACFCACLQVCLPLHLVFNTCTRTTKNSNIVQRNRTTFVIPPLPPAGSRRDRRGPVRHSPGDRHRERCEGSRSACGLNYYRPPDCLPRRTQWWRSGVWNGALRTTHLSSYHLRQCPQCTGI